MDPPQIPGHTWRSVEEADAQSLVDLELACDPIDDLSNIASVEETVRELRSEEVDPQEDTMVLIEDNGDAAKAMAWAMRRASDRKYRLYLYGIVHPDFRRRGIGSYFLSWGERRALTVFDDQRTPEQVIRVSCEDYQADRIELFEAHGYRLVRYFSEMEASLEADRPSPGEIPTGVAVSSWISGSSEAVRVAHTEAFADHWGSVGIPGPAWRNYFDDNEQFRPQMSYVATSGDDVVCYCLVHVDDLDNKRKNRLVGYVSTVGTRRSWRGKGLATHLIALSMGAMKRAGLDTARLDVDTKNPTGALGLYGRLGFVPTRTGLSWVKELQADGTLK